MLPSKTRPGANGNAFIGGYRLWSKQHGKGSIYATLSKGYVLILHLQSSDPRGLDVLKNILQTVKFTDSAN
jgi:hypothetical protein